MSCEVKPFANIKDFKKIQELFGFGQDDNWLNAVYYSISPTCETIAFGHGAKLIILTSQWPHMNQQMPTYTITWKGELENENEIITSILCLPFYGNNVSCGADWTCIAVGLSSGLVLFYTDSGVQIFSQRWHQENVQFLKAQSGSRLGDEIHIGYISCVCVLQGVQLFTVLKGIKQNLMKSSRSNRIQLPDTVPCRKWEYRTRSGGTINDAVIVGAQESCAFDHYLEQSLEKGFYAKCRSSPPQNSLVVGVGVKPYVGFYYAKEGYVAADFGDVAKAVANKVMSSLPGWLFRSSNQEQVSANKVETPVPPGEPMNCRFGICDIQRQGFNIWLAPGNDLAVVADNLHRVILVDVNRGIALRIWKGYRDAQCGFLRVKEKSLKNTNKSEKRKCLFLIIYAPRMSCLEIWALQNGPKVAAFTVSKNGQLIYNTHGLMDISQGAKAKYTLNSCIFIDPSDETLKEISVPFHCALSEGNSKTAKDIHLLRRMKLFLRADAKEDEVIPEIQTLCNNLQTNELRLQCLQMLSKNKRVKPQIFQVAIQTLQKAVGNREDETIEDTDYNLENSQTETSIGNIHYHKSLPILLDNYEKLVEFYIKIKEPVHLDENIKLASGKLIINKNDLETFQKLLDLRKCQKSGTENTSKVKFEDKQHSGDFVEFLNIFLVETEELCLNPKKSELFGFIGSNLFSKFLEKGQDLNAFVDSVKDTAIPTEDLLYLVLYYWLERNFTYSDCEKIIVDMTRLSIVINHICHKAGDKIKYSYGGICPWWQNVRELLLESRSALRGFLAGIVCRNVAFYIRKKESESEGTSDEQNVEIWEEISQEAAEWSLLSYKLEDIALLSAILSCPLISSQPLVPIIPYEKPDCSLKSIICGGKGIVSELTAKWLTNSGIHPSKLLENQKLEKDDNNLTDDDEDEKKISLTPNTLKEDLLEIEKDPVLVNLQYLREHFPFSLESGILYCHMTWEFMSHWSKNLTRLEYLKAGLTCLECFQTEDLALKHGLCGMIWNAHLKIPLEATKKLIHKVGKLPKEKLCQQDIGMSMQAVPEFLEFCLEFLKHFQTSLNHDKRELKFDEILQNDQTPLAFLALQQNHAIFEILNLHIELCKVMHLIAFFSLKVSKPFTNLFDAMSNQTFFVEINRELNYSLTRADFVLQKRREEFLCQAVSASMDLIREDLERLYVLEHATYMEKIEQLADLWDLDKTTIKKHQIVEMYAHGWDAYAEELLQSIVDQESIGVLLLEIAGRRLSLYSSNSQSIFCQVASIGPQLLNYLDNLKTKAYGVQITAENPDEIDLESMTNLAAKAFECLSAKESRYLHIAGQMYDACSILKSIAVK